MDKFVGKVGRVAGRLEYIIRLGRLGRVRKCWPSWFTIAQSEAASARCSVAKRSNDQRERQREVERKGESKRRANGESVCLWKRSLVFLATMASLGGLRKLQSLHSSQLNRAKIPLCRRWRLICAWPTKKGTHPQRFRPFWTKPTKSTAETTSSRSMQPPRA